MQFLSRFAFANLTAISLLSACTDETAPSSPTPEGPTEEPARDIRDILELDDVAVHPSRCIALDAGSAMYGTAGDDELRDVTVAPDGTILIAGFVDGRAAIGSRGVVLEYKHHGFRQRAMLDTAGTDSFESIALDPDTNRIWVAGRTNGDLSGFPGRGDFDYLLGRLGSAGFEPVDRGNYSTQDSPKQLAVANGLVAVAGHEERLVSDGSTWIEPFVSALTTDGAPQWYTYRSTADIERFSAVDISGTSVLAGGQTAQGAQPGMFVALYTAESNFPTRYRISTLGTDELAAIRTLPNGDILWAGTTSGQLGEMAHGGKDIVVGRLDATGASLWVAQLGTEGDDHVDDLAIDEAGNIYVAADATTGDSADRDVVLLSLDSDGAVRSYEQWGSSGDDVPTAIALDTCGTAVLVGHTTGDLAGASLGGRDGFMITSRVRL